MNVLERFKYNFYVLASIWSHRSSLDNLIYIFMNNLFVVDVATELWISQLVQISTVRPVLFRRAIAFIIVRTRRFVNNTVNTVFSVFLKVESVTTDAAAATAKTSTSKAYSTPSDKCGKHPMDNHWGKLFWWCRMQIQWRLMIACFRFNTTKCKTHWIHVYSNNNSSIMLGSIVWDWLLLRM